jgi:hypothetical protein
MSTPIIAYLIPEAPDLIVVDELYSQAGECSGSRHREHPSRERGLCTRAPSSPQEHHFVHNRPDGEEPPGLVAFRPAASNAHVGDDFAVVTDQVVWQPRLQLHQEFSALDGFPGRVGRRVPAGEPALIPVPDDRRCPAPLKVLRRGHGYPDVELAGEGDSATELDDAIIADVDAVMELQARAADMAVITRLNLPLIVPRYLTAARSRVTSPLPARNSSEPGRSLTMSS